MPKSHEIDPEVKSRIFKNELTTELRRIIRRISRRGQQEATSEEKERILEIKESIRKINRGEWNVWQ